MGRCPTSGQPRILLEDAQREEVGRQLNDKYLPTMLGRLEVVLAATAGPYYCSALTICDLASYVLIDGLLHENYCAGIARDVLASCPALRENAKHVGEIPAVRQWLARAAADR